MKFFLWQAFSTKFVQRNWMCASLSETHFYLRWYPIFFLLLNLWQLFSIDVALCHFVTSRDYYFFFYEFSHCVSMLNWNGAVWQRNFIPHTINRVDGRISATTLQQEWRMKESVSHRNGYDATTLYHSLPTTNVTLPSNTIYTQ